MLSVFTILLLIVGASLFYHLYSVGHSVDEDFCAEDNKFCKDSHEDCFFPECMRYGCEGLDEAD